jgi:hypothetical protein
MEWMWAVFFEPAAAYRCEPEAGWALGLPLNSAPVGAFLLAHCP